MRLAREIAAQDEADGSGGNLEAIMESQDDDDNKIYIAMGVSKTISTVSGVRLYLTDTKLMSFCRLFPPLKVVPRYFRKCKRSSFLLSCSL